MKNIKSKSSNDVKKSLVKKFIKNKFGKNMSCKYHAFNKDSEYEAQFYGDIEDLLIEFINFREDK